MTKKSARLYSLVGNLIRSSRLQEGISQDKLARAINLTRSSVTNIEKGRQKILLDTLWQIAGILKKPIMNFIPPPEEVNMSLVEQLPDNTPTGVKTFINELVDSA